MDIKIPDPVLTVEVQAKYNYNDFDSWAVRGTTYRALLFIGEICVMEREYDEGSESHYVYDQDDARDAILQEFAIKMKALLNE